MPEKQFPQRKSPRLKGYDYSQSGAYFVTICTHHQAHLFGCVVDGEMVLNGYGEIATFCWAEIPAHYPNVELDLYVIMPNHMHGIIVIYDDDFGRDISRPYNNRDTVGTPYMASGAQSKRPPLGCIIGAYKAAVTRKIDNSDVKIWQNRYHDHIIRNEPSLDKIREYVLCNPARWAEDTFYCDNYD